MSDLRIVHLYAAHMNIYGDAGNVICLRRRLEWRGIGVEVWRVEVGEPLDFASVDIVVAGGGEDRAQVEVAADLVRRSAAIHEAVGDGVVFLTVCGTYQLFGRRFVTVGGQELPGIGVFAAETLGGTRRMIGNVVVEAPWGRLVGFENHSGRTVLDTGQESLGSVVRGHGNDGDSGEEGAVTVNCFGTYLHGSVLPKNPHFADELIRRALFRRHGDDVTLDPLDDHLELTAAEVAAGRA
ncbi:MAG: glutamine amidotransferase [Acidimicrobiia bacterium]